MKLAVEGQNLRHAMSATWPSYSLSDSSLPDFTQFSHGVGGVWRVGEWGISKNVVPMFINHQLQDAVWHRLEGLSSFPIRLMFRFVVITHESFWIAWGGQLGWCWDYKTKLLKNGQVWDLFPLLRRGLPQTRTEARCSGWVKQWTLLHLFWDIYEVLLFGALILPPLPWSIIQVFDGLGLTFCLEFANSSSFSNSSVDVLAC